jgi:hypothetical protein
VNGGGDAFLNAKARRFSGDSMRVRVQVRLRLFPGRRSWTPERGGFLTSPLPEFHAGSWSSGSLL